MKKDNSAKSLPVKASKYPTKRTVNLAQRESHSRSTLTLTLGLVLIVVLSFCVANFGVLRQLDRQRAAENAYNTVHSQYTQMQQALADYDNVELQYRTYSRTWMQEEDSPFYIPVDRLEVLDLLEGYLKPCWWRMMWPSSPCPAWIWSRSPPCSSVCSSSPSSRAHR